MTSTYARRIGGIILGALFICTGTLHFLATGFLLRMMPPYIPFPYMAIYLSGAIEVLLGALLIHGKYLLTARWGLTALLLAVFPANIHMALHPELFPDISELLAWGRLPLQLVLLLVVWRATSSAGS